MWLEYSVVGEDRRIGVVVSQAVWRGARGGWLRCVALRRSPSLPQPSAADGTRDEDSDYSFGREQVMLVRYNASIRKFASLPFTQNLLWHECAIYISLGHRCMHETRMHHVT